MSRARLQISAVRGTGGHAWRLMSALNEPLGCGVATYATAQDCSRGLQRLCLAARSTHATDGPDLVGVQSIDLDSCRWVWRVEKRGLTVAVSPGDVEGQRENEAALGQFLLDLRHADRDPDAGWIVLPAPRRVRDLRDVWLLQS